MSRLAKKPIIIPQGVTISAENGAIFVKGPKGELSRNFRSDLIDVLISEEKTEVKGKKMTQQTKMLLGTYASHIKNMIDGVMNGFQKKLIIEGVGYKAEGRGGKEIVFSLGYSHPVIFESLEGVILTTEKNNIIVSGIDKEKVGLVASKIRLLKKPEPYKGKGIRYANEIIKKKAGKKAASGS